MRATYYGLGLLASLLFVTGEAMPCGGAFGNNYTIQPAQKIVVGYRSGVETYVFNPNFCGKADTFGLILPIPSTLTANPTLGTQQLYADLATIAAPTIVSKKECSKGVGGASWNGTGGALNGGGTSVIQRGQVGIFDWALLKAADTSSFTEWLTTNGFPYPPTAVSTFQSYVDNGWYFVAFKVSPGGSSGAAGAPGTATTTICGSFGPVSLSFAIAPNPVIPARIAVVNTSSVSWDVFALGATQMRMRSETPTLMFSGSISAADLASHPALAQVAQPGDRLTELELHTTPTADLVLEPDPNQADYRRTETQTQWITCAGGVGNAGSAGKAGSAAVAGRAASGGSGLDNGGVSTGGQRSGGGGTTTGGTSSGASPGIGNGTSSGGNASGGVSATLGGALGVSGAALNKDGGATSVPVGQASVPTATAEPATGCNCALESRGNAAQRGLLAAFAALLAWSRRRRSRRHD